MQFSGQHEGEEVLFFFRKHPVVLRKAFYIFIGIWLLAMVPFLAVDPLNSLFQQIAIGGFFVGLLVFLYYWMGWYYSIYLVTNERLIENYQKGLFGKKVVQVDLDKIQNINYEIPGLQGSLLKFGTVVVQTYVGDMIIDNVHHPEEVQQELSHAVRDYAGGYESGQN